MFQGGSSLVDRSCAITNLQETANESSLCRPATWRLIIELRSLAYPGAVSRIIGELRGPMHKHSLMVAIALLAGSMVTTPALARAHDKDDDKGHGQVTQRHEHDGDHDRDRGHDRDDDRGDRGDKHTPEHHGKKTGWGDCDLPPGQAKKYGCHHHEHASHTAGTTTVTHKPAPVTSSTPMPTTPRKPTPTTRKQPSLPKIWKPADQAQSQGEAKQ